MRYSMQEDWKHWRQSFPKEIRSPLMLVFWVELLGSDTACVPDFGALSRAVGLWHCTCTLTVFWAQLLGSDTVYLDVGVLSTAVGLWHCVPWHWCFEHSCWPGLWHCILWWLVIPDWKEKAPSPKWVTRSLKSLFRKWALNRGVTGLQTRQASMPFPVKPVAPVPRHLWPLQQTTQPRSPAGRKTTRCRRVKCVAEKALAFTMESTHVRLARWARGFPSTMNRVVLDENAVNTA